VTLTIADGFGRSASTTQTVTVTALAGLTAIFNASPTDPVAGTTVLFNAAQSTAPVGHRIVSYTWNFGDPFDSAIVTTGAPQASHRYTRVGTYNVTLTVTDDTGNSVTSSPIPIAVK
jgi:PKD repeat protein